MEQPNITQAEKAARKELAVITTEMIDCYRVITALLGRLPIPVLLSKVRPDLTAMSRARVLADYEPLGEDVKEHIRSMLLDWITAYEARQLASLFGPAPWRLNIMVQALGRVRVSAAYIEDWL